MSWRLFIGAAIIVGGSLLRFAPWPAIVAGIGLAALVNWLKMRGGASKTPKALVKGR
jgi:hypothetical protein